MTRRPNSANDLINNFLYRPYMGSTQSVSDERTVMIENMYTRKLTEMCMSRFKWEGLPKSIDVRFLEYTLLHSGLAIVFKDELYDAILATRATPLGSFNLYDNPKRFQAYGTNYRGKIMSQKDCAPVWGTLTRSSTDIDIVRIYAHRIAQMDRTIEINTQNARRPKAIVLQEEEQTSVDNIINAINRGEPVVKLTEPDIMQRLERTLDFGVDPKSIEVLSVIRARVVNECMSLLGIDNANQDKKERLVAAEVDANDEQVSVGKSSILIPRQQGAELINRLFPEYNVTVSFDTGQESEEGSNDNLYDDAERDKGNSVPSDGMGEDSI